jgi:preprotein translocase subunit Sec63
LKTNRHANIRLDEDPREILGVGPDANDDTIRDAYLRKVKENPPDRAPAAFERIRDAYEALRDPRRRARLTFFSGDPHAPLRKLVPVTSSERKFTGPGPWLAALREK